MLRSLESYAKVPEEPASRHATINQAGQPRGIRYLQVVRQSGQAILRFPGRPGGPPDNGQGSGPGSSSVPY